MRTPGLPATAPRLGPELGPKLAPRSEWVPGVGRGQAAGTATSECQREHSAPLQVNGGPSKSRDAWVCSRGWAAAAAARTWALMPAPGPQEHREARVHSHDLGSCSCTWECRAPSCARHCPGPSCSLGPSLLAPLCWTILPPHCRWETWLSPTAVTSRAVGPGELPGAGPGDCRLLSTASSAASSLLSQTKRSSLHLFPAAAVGEVQVAWHPSQPRTNEPDAVGANPGSPGCTFHWVLVGSRNSRGSKVEVATEAPGLGVGPAWP